MWPWGHAALGYLVYAILRRGRGRPWPPSDVTAIALGIGTQFPDLVDKPLAWSLHLLPSGRSLAHSLITTTLVAVVVLALARRYDQRVPAWAFVVGYYSHLLGDALLPLLQFDTAFLTFLLWPLRPPPPYQMDSNFIEHFVNFSPSGFTLVGMALALSTIALWVTDGLPGLGWLAKEPRRPTSDD
ncbi:metal-dependent hydrolase [Halomarina salina]|uniref:Metal-dependent hydrolase n=1 Tax=Halomarina salina TaxID=1872699 RepID=A0ABD5RIZ2_9EURY|nr:metal-dependent hydrolase [Halomarina salina]